MILAIKADRWLVPLVFLISFIVFYYSAVPLLDDADVPWHLAAGNLLLSTHTLPKTDPWSFASNGAPWYLLSWVWDMVLGITERLSGLFGVYIFTVAVSAGLIAFLASLLLERAIALPAIFFTLMLASLCLLEFITARPQLIGYVMALVFYALLYKNRTENGYGSLKWLPPLMLIWANMHGSFIAGFTVLGAYGIEALYAHNREWLKRLIIITVACVIAAFINPYGPALASGALRTLNGGAIKYTVEWLPFSFSASAGVSAWLIVFILASNLRISSAPIADKLLAIGWLVASLFVIRNGAIFILLSAPYLAACLDGQTRDLRETRTPSAFLGFMRRQKLMPVWIACIAAAMAFTAGAYALPHEGRIQTPDFSVADAIDYGLKYYPENHYLTDFNFGGEVIYRAHGRIHFFMDSRAATAYGEQPMLDYLEFLWQKPGWQGRMDKYGIDGMILDNTTRFAKNYENGQYRQQWKLVFAGKRANVYIAQPQPEHEK